jgi:hypothetical protein
MGALDPEVNDIVWLKPPATQEVQLSGSTRATSRGPRRRASLRIATERHLVARVEHRKAGQISGVPAYVEPSFRTARAHGVTRELALAIGRSAGSERNLMERCQRICR